MSLTCLGPGFSPSKDASMFRLRERKSSTAAPPLSPHRAPVRAEDALCLTLACIALNPLFPATAGAQTNIAFAGSGPATSTAAPAPVLGPIPFRRGFPLTINDNGPFTFHINPGAPSAFYLSSTMAQELGLTVLTHGGYRLLDESSPSSGRYVDMVRIDQMHLAGADFRDLRGISTPQDNSAVVGIPAFHGMVLTLDFPHDRLTVTPGGLTGTDGHLATPDNRTLFHFAGDETTPVVPITLNGMPLSAHLDASAGEVDADIMVPIDIGKRLPLTAPMREDGYFQDGIGRTWLRFRGTLNGDLQIGDLVVHHPTVIISNRFSYVNLEGVFRRMIVRLDIDNHLVEMHLADTIATPLPHAP